MDFDNIYEGLPDSPNADEVMAELVATYGMIPDEDTNVFVTWNSPPHRTFELEKIYFSLPRNHAFKTVLLAEIVVDAAWKLINTEPDDEGRCEQGQYNIIDDDEASRLILHLASDRYTRHYVIQMASPSDGRLEHRFAELVHRLSIHYPDEL